MAINFPDTPSVDQEFTAADRTWIYNGTVWLDKGSTLDIGELSDVTVSNPAEGEVVQYVSGQFVNSPVDYAELTSVPTTFAPSAHAASHESGGADALQLDASQISNLQVTPGFETNFLLMGA